MPIDRYAPHAHDAIERALAQVGDAYQPGWCLRWSAAVYGVPGVGDWDGDSANDAEDFWKAAKARGTVVETSDPKKLVVGSMAMWVGGRNDHGHAAPVVDVAKIVSTDLPKTGRIGLVDAALPHTAWGLTLVGCILVDGNGYRLTRDPKEPALKTYKVTAESGLRGRALPNTSSATIRVAKHKEKLVPTRLVQAANRVWAVVPLKGKDVYYAFEYLERV